MELTRRVAGGFVAMPPVAAIAGFAWAFTRAKMGYSSPPPIEAGMVVGAFQFVTAIPITAGAGGLFFWWTNWRRATLIWTAVWSALLGNIPTLLAVTMSVSVRLARRESLAGLSQFSTILAMGTSTGIACGIVFWLIALWKAETVDRRSDSHA